jgi:hypothetical protein
MPTETTSPLSRSTFAPTNAVSSTSASVPEVSPKPVPRIKRFSESDIQLPGSPGFKPVLRRRAAVRIIGALLIKEVLGNSNLGNKNPAFAGILEAL